MLTAANPYAEPCEQIVHPSFDRQFAPLFDTRIGGSVQRKVLAVDPGAVPSCSGP